jgi:hypothetical protein
MPTSVVGQSRRFDDVRVTSALPLIADLRLKDRHVRLVPETDIGADLVSRAAERLALTRDQRPSYLALEDDHRRLLRMDAPAC